MAGPSPLRLQAPLTKPLSTVAPAASKDTAPAAATSAPVELEMPDAPVATTQTTRGTTAALAAPTIPAASEPTAVALPAQSRDGFLRYQRSLESLRQRGLTAHGSGFQTIAPKTLGQITAAVFYPAAVTPQRLQMVAEANPQLFPTLDASTIAAAGAEISLSGTPLGLEIDDLALQTQIAIDNAVLARAGSRIDDSPAQTRAIEAEVKAASGLRDTLQAQRQILQLRDRIGIAEEKAQGERDPEKVLALYDEVKKSIAALPASDRAAMTLLVWQSQIGSEVSIGTPASLTRAIGVADQLLAASPPEVRDALLSQRADLFLERARAGVREIEAAGASRVLPASLASDFDAALQAQTTTGHASDDERVHLAVEKFSSLALLSSRMDAPAQELTYRQAALAVALGLPDDAVDSATSPAANRPNHFLDNGPIALATALDRLPTERRALAIELLLQCAENSLEAPGLLEKVRPLLDVIKTKCAFSPDRTVRVRALLLDGKLALRNDDGAVAVHRFDAAFAALGEHNDSFSRQATSDLFTAKLTALALQAATRPPHESAQALADLTATRERAELNSDIFTPAQLSGFCLLEANVAASLSRGEVAQHALAHYQAQYLDRVPGVRAQADAFRAAYVRGDLKACVRTGLAMLGRGAIEDHVIAALVGSAAADAGAAGGVALAAWLFGPEVGLPATAIMGAVGATTGFALGYGGVRAYTVGEEGRRQIWDAFHTGVSPASDAEVRVGATTLATEAALAIFPAARGAFKLGSAGVKTLVGAALTEAEHKTRDLFVAQIQRGLRREGRLVGVAEINEKFVRAEYLALFRRAAALPGVVSVGMTASAAAQIALGPGSLADKADAVAKMGAVFASYAVLHVAVGGAAKLAYGPGVAAEAVRARISAMVGTQPTAYLLDSASYRAELQAMQGEAAALDPTADVSHFGHVGPAYYDPVENHFIFDRGAVAKMSDAEVQQLIAHERVHQIFNCLPEQARGEIVAAFKADPARWQQITTRFFALRPYAKNWDDARIVSELLASQQSGGDDMLARWVAAIPTPRQLESAALRLLPEQLAELRHSGKLVLSAPLLPPTTLQVEAHPDGREPSWVKNTNGELFKEGEVVRFEVYPTGLTRQGKIKSIQEVTNAFGQKIVQIRVDLEGRGHDYILFATADGFQHVSTKPRSQVKAPIEPAVPTKANEEIGLPVQVVYDRTGRALEVYQTQMIKNEIVLVVRPQGQTTAGGYTYLPLRQSFSSPPKPGGGKPMLESALQRDSMATPFGTVRPGDEVSDAHGNLLRVKALLDMPLDDGTSSLTIWTDVVRRAPGTKGGPREIGLTPAEARPAYEKPSPDLSALPYRPISRYAFQGVVPNEQLAFAHPFFQRPGHEYLFGSADEANGVVHLEDVTVKTGRIANATMPIADFTAHKIQLGDYVTTTSHEAPEGRVVEIVSAAKVKLELADGRTKIFPVSQIGKHPGFVSGESVAWSDGQWVVVDINAAKKLAVLRQGVTLVGAPLAELRSVNPIHRTMRVTSAGREMGQVVRVSPDRLVLEVWEKGAAGDRRYLQSFPRKDFVVDGDTLRHRAPDAVTHPPVVTPPAPKNPVVVVLPTREHAGWRVGDPVELTSSFLDPEIKGKTALIEGFMSATLDGKTQVYFKVRTPDGRLHELRADLFGTPRL